MGDEDTKGRFTRMFEREFIADEKARLERERKDNIELSAQSLRSMEEARRAVIGDIVQVFRNRFPLLARKFEHVEEDKEAGDDRVRYRFPSTGAHPRNGLVEFWCEYGRVGDAFHIHSYVEVDGEGVNDRISFPARDPKMERVETFVEAKLLVFVQRYVKD